MGGSIGNQMLWEEAYRESNAVEGRIGNQMLWEEA
jgi:hypothetical protein